MKTDLLAEPGAPELGSGKPAVSDETRVAGAPGESVTSPDSRTSAFAWRSAVPAFALVFGWFSPAAGFRRIGFRIK